MRTTKPQFSMGHVFSAAQQSTTSRWRRFARIFCSSVDLSSTGAQRTSNSSPHLNPGHGMQLRPLSRTCTVTEPDQHSTQNECPESHCRRRLPGWDTFPSRKACRTSGGNMHSPQTKQLSPSSSSGAVVGAGAAGGAADDRSGIVTPSPDSGGPGGTGTIAAADDGGAAGGAGGSCSMAGAASVVCSAAPLLPLAAGIDDPTAASVDSTFSSDTSAVVVTTTEGAV